LEPELELAVDNWHILDSELILEEQLALEHEIKHCPLTWKIN
jgi:hypothetical protein